MASEAFCYEHVSFVVTHGPSCGKIWTRLKEHLPPPPPSPVANMYGTLLIGALSKL